MTGGPGQQTEDHPQAGGTLGKSWRRETKGGLAQAVTNIIAKINKIAYLAIKKNIYIYICFEY